MTNQLAAARQRGTDETVVDIADSSGPSFLLPADHSPREGRTVMAQWRRLPGRLLLRRQPPALARPALPVWRGAQIVTLERQLAEHQRVIGLLVDQLGGEAFIPDAGLAEPQIVLSVVEDRMNMGWRLTTRRTGALKTTAHPGTSSAGQDTASGAPGLIEAASEYGHER